MPVKVRCSGCQKVLNAPDKARGRTVKCPGCSTPIKVPGGKPKSKPQGGSSSFDDDFLSGLDLRQAEDRSTQVCPKCGAAVDEMDEECPACGVDLSTGTASITGKRRKKKSESSKFYKVVWSDSWAFTKKNFGYAIKTSIYSLLLGLIAAGCLFMTLWSSNVPPKVFWGFCAFVVIMAPIGWPWFLTNETIRLSLSRKDELKRVNFDFFICVSLGIKFFVWTAVFGLPILALCGGGGFLMFKNGNLPAAAALVGVGLALIYSMLPVALTHMAMPITTPGWMINKVAPGWGKSFGGILFLFLVFLVTSLPVTGPLGAAGAVYAGKIEGVFRTLQRNSAIDRAQQTVDALDPGEEAEINTAITASLEKLTVDWNSLIIPAVLVAVALAGNGFVVLYNARAIGLFSYYFKDNLDLNTLERQVTYVKKEQKFDKHGNPIDPFATPAWLKVIIVIVALILLYVVANIISYFAADKYLMPESMSRALGLPD